MLPPDYLSQNADKITSIYADLHTAILTDIARHIRDTLAATGKSRLMPSTVYQIERLNRAGMLREDIIREIAKINKTSRAEIREMFRDAAIKTRVYDDRIYRAAGFDPIPVMQSPGLLRILEAGINRAAGR